MKKILVFLLTSFIYLNLTINALAVCPACIVVEGVGIGFLRWLGIDDVILGIWIGALCVSMALCINSFLIKKNKKYPGQLLFILALIYFPNLIFLDKMGLLSNNFRLIAGINRLLAGTIIGSIIIFVALLIDDYLRMQNKGTVKFYYQKIIIPIFLLTFISIIFYFMGR